MPWERRSGRIGVATCSEDCLGSRRIKNKEASSDREVRWLVEEVEGRIDR